MCKKGQTIDCLVPIHSKDSVTGTLVWRIKAIDSCLADKVKTLNRQGKLTRSCCCGHGKYQGSIWLHDGTDILV